MLKSRSIDPRRERERDSIYILIITLISFLVTPHPLSPSVSFKMRWSLMFFSFLFLLLSDLSCLVSSYFITVDAHAEECFFDKVKMGTKMGLMFEVAEGGFLDIDVRIEGPDGEH